MCVATTYNNLYLDARQKLKAAGVEAAQLEARELVCFAAGKNREQFFRDMSLYASDEVEAKVEVVKGASLPVPVVVSGGVIMTVASAPTLDEAALNATHNMMDLITGGSSIDPQEAGMLLSLKGDLRICQIVDPMRTARMEFPMTVLERFGFRLP